MSTGKQPQDALLHIRDLHAGYTVAGRVGLGRRRVDAVAGVDLAVRPGRTVCIVGESGCGKSTLARAVVGLLPPFAGSVSFAGLDLATAGRRERRRVANDLQMVFQDPYTSLNPRMRVAEIVAEGWHIHKERAPADEAQEVAGLLTRVGLDASYAGRRLHELSGGQCQRVSIARALALRPKLIVCDEAVSALDVSVRAQILNLLADLQRELGIAYLFISHDLDVVRHIADEVAVMYLGTIVEHGTAAQVFESPQHPYTQALLAAAPSVHDRPDTTATLPLTGEVPSPADPPPGCRFHTRCPLATDLCRTDPPALRVRDEGTHPAACHYAGEPAGEAVAR
ncbi:dipeptide/oligopeptide/nickel ABC transporter ATP-binding protein [Streptomyces sp. WAC 06738]|uniref:ABC transporter ATP-binding protein n=1 Tax=Streptomyces sp. WAC 06738 TaxID=2203210 RepID=UPI000F70F34C|nr:oligopeptide/dipeptide ABC transporter ATP-binding protein [Streptomyces sp. WAC 06738]AZM47476.1 dipeptide/oligopeptide/nickel ABC transporter ATP-binding protein [Streptomyces sp. WAC 06738]